MEKEEKLEQFQLSEVDVLSVGLVQAGAIGEDWFLTKSDGGGSMADEKKDVEVIDTNDEKFWAKVQKFITDAVAKIQAESDTVEKEEPVAESEDVKAELSVEEDKGDETVTKEVEKVEAETEVKVEVPEETLDIAAQLAEIQKSLESKYEGTIKGLQEKVVGLEKKNADTEETAERKEFVEKARDFRALPGKYPEMGAKFYNLSKSSEKDDFDWLMALLKAADEQLAMAGIFNERGTTLAPESIKLEDKVLKQAEEDEISIDEAMLKLSREEQENMLRVSRQEAE